MTQVVLMFRLEGVKMDSFPILYNGNQTNVIGVVKLNSYVKNELLNGAKFEIKALTSLNDENGQKELFSVSLTHQHSPRTFATEKIIEEYNGG